MIILIIFAFLAGIVTILSPCILPILPIVLSSSVVGGRRRPFGVVTGFILSFTFFTLFLTSIVRAFGISPDILRSFSVIVILLFGLALVLPGFQRLTELLFAKLSNYMPRSQGRTGFTGGLLVGLSIGLIWTPCVGPILGSVISLALTGTVTGTAVLITLSYAFGTAIPMFAIVYGGRNLLNKVPWLIRNTGMVQRVFGILMIITAIAIYFNFDRQFQTYVLNTFPNYGTGLTKLEENKAVQRQLGDLNSGEQEPKSSGKPMFDMLDNLGRAPELIPGGQWFNLPEGQNSLKISDLKGKVVIIDFWTYTCINCIRTLPYLKAWDEKYRDKGLVIIGVHTPEFEFEKDADNVKKAIEDFEIKYPVMQDNNYATWNAYNNRYWPAKYFIDKNGNIRFTHFGEGAYDESEKIIQTLLEEAGSDVSDVSVNNPTYKVTTRTPETYLGYKRLGDLASPERITPNKKMTFTAPTKLLSNYFAYSGVWTIGDERAMPEVEATLLFNFDAKDVFLVMRPNGSSGKVKVYLDNLLVNEDIKGDDVVDGVVTVDTDRLYELISLPKEGRHILKLEFLDSNLELYAFTFG